VIPRADFVAEVLTYVGTPFLFQGRVPGKALDCAGVVACALGHFGLASPEIHYGSQPSEAELFDGLAAVAAPIALELREPGDVLTFAVGSRTIHMGVYSGRIGASEVVVQPSKRRVIENSVFHPERDDVRSCWKLKGVG